MGLLASFIDNAIAEISPAAGARRRVARLRLQRADKVRSELSSGGHQSAQKGRDSHNWLTSRLSPDSALESDREETLRRADSTAKNYELGANHIEGRAIRVIGTGSTLDPEIVESEGIAEEQAERWNTVLREDWERQIERIGKGDKHLRKVQQLSHRHYERHGEFFWLIGDEFDPLMPTTLRVEVIHPNRVATPPEKAGDPRCRMGVQLDESGVAVGYWIRETHPGDTKEYRENYKFYPRKLKNGLLRVVHVYDEAQSGEHRGMPRLQVGMPRLKNSEDYSDAELERNYVSACHAAFVRTDLDESEAKSGEVIGADGERLRDFAPGTVNYLGLADEITLSNPNGAPASYEAFVMHQGRMFAAGAGTSYEVAANDYRGVTYSVGRLIWNVEEGVCKVLHANHVDALAELYRHFVTRKVISADADLDIDQVAFRSRPWLYWKARILPPSRSSIDPSRENNARVSLAEKQVIPGCDVVEQFNGRPARSVYAAMARDKKLREFYGVAAIEPLNRPTELGDPNPAAAEANEGGEANPARQTEEAVA